MTTRTSVRVGDNKNHLEKGTVVNAKKPEDKEWGVFKRLPVPGLLLASAFVVLSLDPFSAIWSWVVFGGVYAVFVLGTLIWSLVPLLPGKKTKRSIGRVGAVIVTASLVCAFGTLPPQARAQEPTIVTKEIQIPIPAPTPDAGDGGAVQNPFGLPDGVYAACIPVDGGFPDGPWDNVDISGPPMVLNFSTTPGISPRIELVNPQGIHLIEVDELLGRFGLNTNCWDNLRPSYSINSNSVSSLPFPVSFNRLTGTVTIGNGVSNIVSLIQMSTNLVDWVSVGPAISLPSGVNVRATDNISPPVGTLSEAYYRLVTFPDVVISPNDDIIMPNLLPVWACIVIIIIILLIIGGFAYLIYKIIKKCQKIKQDYDRNHRDTDDPPKNPNDITVVPDPTSDQSMLV